MSDSVRQARERAEFDLYHLTRQWEDTDDQLAARVAQHVRAAEDRTGTLRRAPAGRAPAPVIQAATALPCAWEPIRCR